MKKNQITFLLFSIVFALLCQNASAALTLIDQFTAYNNGQLGVSGTGGSPNTWANNQALITVTNGSGSLDGTALGLVASAGDKVSIGSNGVANVGCYNKWVASGTFLPSVTTNIYYSFLYRFNVGSDISPNGQVINQVNRQNSGFGTGIHWQLVVKSVGGNNVQLGILQSGGVTNYDATTIAAGQTVFVVIKEAILAGTTAPNIDTNCLWINPPPASFFTNEANVPTPDVVTSDGADDSSTTGPGRFWIFEAGNANFDELRIGSTWADVTPYFGQCISAGIAVSPVNQTNSAEIGYTFTVGAIGTSPTYQWQISGPVSSTWTNINGATLSTYTTPNLALATDNGDKYRAIVTVPCDGSSATSTVATVALKAPVITPVGVVVDDLFAAAVTALTEPITPVTISNAAWYTATAGNLDVYHGGNPGPPLVATPTAGSSSLWLAYFVNETNSPVVTNKPVHLAVGNTIRVTLLFTPNSFNSFTNNAAFRMGLFDYADGGTFITNDDATVGGSTGNGINVRGYMLSLDWGTNFTASSPLSLLARTSLSDINLMGASGDYLSLGSGPSGGGFTGLAAFQPGVQYTLMFSVARTDINTVNITATITNNVNPTNWTFTVTETNLAYHRFDAFGMRPNSLETSADSFNIPEFKVEVLAASLPPTSITITNVSRSGNSVTLTWNPTPSGTYSYSVMSKTNLTDATWITNQTGITTTSYTDPTAAANMRFYRVSSP